MDDSAVISAIRNKGYPDDLLDAEISEAIATVVREVSQEYPVQTWGTFTTVAGQQLYDLFNPVLNSATQQGVFAGGLQILEMVGAPGGSTTGNIDIFGIIPLLQNAQLTGGGQIMCYSFNNPSDYAIWESNWESFIRRFGTIDFRPTKNVPGAPVRIFPVPDGADTVYCRYTTPRSASAIKAEDEGWYLLMVEEKCCRVLCRKFSASAGIQVGDNRDLGKTLEYWQQEQIRLQGEAKTQFENRQFETVSAGARS